MNAERYYLGRSEGLVDIAWAEVVLPENGGACPICDVVWPDCGGHDQREPAVLGLCLPVLAAWRPEMSPRDQAVVDRMLADAGQNHDGAVT